MAVVNTVNELIELLNQVDQDATVLAAIANDSATATGSGPGAGLVLTRLGSTVKNVQKVIADIENGITAGVRPKIQKDGITIVPNAPLINFAGANLTVTDVGGVATIAVTNLPETVEVTGTPVDNQLAVWVDDRTVEGTTELSWDSNTFSINGPATPRIRLIDLANSVTYTENIINPGTPVVLVGTSTAHDVRLQTGGTARLTMDTSGQFGFGTTSPSSFLHLSSATPTIRIEDTDAAASGYSLITVGPAGELTFSADPTNVEASSFVAFFVDGSEAFRIIDNGNVGIGTSTPSSLLDVTGNLNNQYGLEVINNSSTANGIYAYVNNSLSDKSLLKLQSSTSQVFAVQADGNVGIGTFSPSDNLTVIGTVGVSEYVTATKQVNAQTGVAYTLALSDTNGIITMDNASSNTLTIDPVATTAYPLGTYVRVAQLGAGATTITAGAGVTLNGVTAGSGTITAQYDIIELFHVASDTWLVTGDIGAIA